MSAGMMPALDLPGEATPGQFGPTMRVTLPFAVAYAQNSVESCTGMPSVITMTSGIPASIASITALLAPAGGTNTTETSAPVAAADGRAAPRVGARGGEREAGAPAGRRRRGGGRVGLAGARGRAAGGAGERVGRAGEGEVRVDERAAGRRRGALDIGPEGVG